MKDHREKYRESNGLRIAHTALPEKGIASSNQTPSLADHHVPLIAEKASEICLIVEEKGRIKYSNQAIQNALNFDPSRVIGNSIHSLIPADQAMVFRAALKASSEEASAPIVIDCQLQNQAGKRVHFRLSIVDCRHHPHIEGFLIHANNIARLKYQEHKLQIAQAVLSCQEEAMLLIDWKSKRIEYANSAFSDLSGFSKTELFGGKLNFFQAPYKHFLFAEGTSFKEVSKFNRCMKANRAFLGKVYSKTKNGRVFYHHLKVVPILGQNGETLQYYVSFRPIKKRKITN